jgi:hypothetical protein
MRDGPGATNSNHIGDAAATAVGVDINPWRRRDGPGATNSNHIGDAAATAVGVDINPWRRP